MTTPGKGLLAHTGTFTRDRSVAAAAWMLNPASSVRYNWHVARTHACTVWEGFQYTGSHGKTASTPTLRRTRLRPHAYITNKMSAER